ncbi:MAG TPA: 6-bladed beta-propeller [Azospira sp.]|nr:6-bladed beta-propeller [Azospira sp.]
MKRLAALACVLLLAACASSGERPTLQFGAQVEAGRKGTMFPAQQAEEVPRYIYVGQLTGEENFVWPEVKTSTFGDVVRWLVGLVGGDSEPESLRRPQHGAIDAAGRILVTDISRQAVAVFDRQAGQLVFWDKAFGYQGFVTPVGLALGSKGDVYVADADLGLVAHLDPDGASLGVIGRGLLQRPTGVAWDAKRKRLYVADTHAHDIKIFDEAGAQVGSFGERGDGKGEYNFPTFLALAGDELYVSDTMNARIQVVGAEHGEFRRSIGTRGTYVGNLVRPKGISLDGEGNLYIVESYHDHLLVFNRQGEFLMPIGGGAGQDVGQYYLPSGVWIDAQNRIFLADTFNGRVVVYQYLGGGAENDE